MGDNVYCPCCNNHFRQFFKDGKYGGCPGCGSSARHRLIVLYLERKTNFFKDRIKALHFAPEHSLFKKFRKMKNLEYISADLGSARAKMKIDMTKIPFVNDFFDVVLSSHVLEHISNDYTAMKELYRIQKPKGWSIHQVPIDKTRNQTFESPNIKTPDQREKVYGHHDHKRIYGLDYPKRLEQAGFKVKCDLFARTLKNEEILRYSLSPDEVVYLCLKE